MAAPQQRTTSASARNQSLARGLLILETLSANGGEERGVRELSRMLEVNKSIVQRLVLTLADFGFVEQNPETGKYRIGPRAFGVGQAYVLNGGLQQAALSELQRLGDQHELNTVLGVLDDGKVVYLLALQSSAAVVLRSRPGARAPLHATSVGKALLASRSDEEIDALLGEGPLERFTSATVTDVARLKEQLQRAREEGYATSREELFPGVLAVGAPIRDHTGNAVAAISGACPLYLVTEDRLAEMVGLVREAAGSISGRLGALEGADG